MVDDAAPRCRARHIQTMLDQAQAHPAWPRISSGIAPSSLAVAREASLMSFLGMALNVEVTLAISRALGEEASAFYQRVTLAQFESPILKPLVSTATSLFGMDVGSMVKWIPRGWSLVFQDCGNFAVDVQEQSAVLSWTNIPGMCMLDPLWLEAVAGSFGSILVLTKRTGRVSTRNVSKSKRSAELVFTWT